MGTSQIKTIDRYIKTFPPDVRSILEKMRQTIQEVIPDATESIGYAIPAFKLNSRYVVYFAGWKQHVSIYPIPSGDKTFQKQISPYVAGRGTVKFPLDKPIPYELVKKIVKFLVKEQRERIEKG